MNILGVSGLEGAAQFKKEHWPGLPDREYRIIQGQDAAAALVVDGVLVAAAAEERFNRQKHSANFPSHAIHFCLAQAGISIGDVDEKASTVTVTHHWMQTFPAGKAVSVKHTFLPRGGFIYDFEYQKTLANDLARDYCVGPVLIKAMKKGQGSITQVHYILKTGANWKGPIGRFVLRVVKDTPKQKSSVCMDGFKKVDARTFVLEKTSFVPTQDLKVAFIDLGG